MLGLADQLGLKAGLMLLMKGQLEVGSQWPGPSRPGVQNKYSDCVRSFRSAALIPKNGIWDVMQEFLKEGRLIFRQ